MIILIDQQKCKRDGICAQECPLGLISWQKGEIPEMTPEAAVSCLTCGHCLAVCMQQALSLETMPLGECELMQKELLPSPEQVEYFMKTRRSIRVYQEKPIPREVIRQLLKTASYAPSGHNTQPVNWLVADDPGRIKELNGYAVEWMRGVMEKEPQMALLLHYDKVIEAWERGEDRICRGAPSIVLSHAPAKHPVAQSSCLIAATYLELAAFGLGLGACWAGYLNAAISSYPPIAKDMGLPEGNRVFSAHTVGYAGSKYYMIPKRNEPRVRWL